MHPRHPLAAASFWFLIAALGVLVGLIAVLCVPGLSTYFFAHQVLLRVGFLVLSVLFVLFTACGSVLGFLAETRPGRLDGVAGAALLLTGVACLAALWINRIP